MQTPILRGAPAATLLGAAACLPALLAPAPSFAQQEKSASNLPDIATVSQETRAKLRDIGKPITLELKEAVAQAALTKLLDLTTFGYSFDPAFYNPAVGGSLDLPGRVLTMKMVNAPIDKALDSVTKALGVGWTAEDEGSSFMLRIVKLKTTQSLGDLARAQGFDGGGLGGGGFGGGGFGGGNVFGLPNGRVNLDFKNAGLRDLLKSFLQSNNAEFALDDDVSEKERYTFTFKGVKFFTALDVICQSAGIGYHIERLTDQKFLVRVSKKYADADAVRR